MIRIFRPDAQGVFRFPLAAGSTVKRTACIALNRSANTEFIMGLSGSARLCLAAEHTDLTAGMNRDRLWSLLALLLLHLSTASSRKAAEGPQGYFNDADKAIVTTIMGKVPYRDLSIENKRTYAERHGYDLLVYDRALSGKFFSNKKDMMFNKPLAIKDAFKTQNYTWIWWLDADCLIMNDDVRFDQLVPSLGKRTDLVDLVFGGDAHAVLNAGSMLFRNSNWTSLLLDQLYTRQDDQSIPNIRDWHEQAILIHLYQTDHKVRDHTLVLPQRALNSYTGNFQWGDFVIHFAGQGKEEACNDEGVCQAERDSFSGRG